MNLSTTKTVAFIAMLFVLTMQKSYPQGCSLSSTNTRSMPFNFYGFNGANLITLDETPLSGPCSGTGWAGFCLKESIMDASFTELRYPAGTVSNYWDWYHGWFLPNRKMPTGYCLEQKYENYAPTDCKIPTFAIAVKKAGVTPIFDLNLMTSDKLYQGAMLYIARALNLSVQNLEMGNEFYHDNKLNVLKYPTPDDHITDANAYLSFINSHFPTGTGTATPFMKSALVGAVSINEPSFSRRNTWLNDLANGTTIDCDAITLHNYTQSGLGTDKMKMDGSNLHVAFHTALTNMISGDGAMNQAMTTINGSLSNGKEIWATEYNLQDGGHLMVGTWAHGLHTITMGMTYLENLFNGETLITKADCHALVGNASSHALFENELGFALNNPDKSYYHDFLGTVDCLTNDWEKQITTTPYTLTASGIALKILGNATEGATTATRIENNDDCRLLGNIEGLNPVNGLYGWFFERLNNYTAVILNLTEVNGCYIDVFNDVFSTVYSSLPFTVDQYFPSDGLPANYPFDGVSCNPSSNDDPIAGVLNAVLGIEDVPDLVTHASYQSRNISHLGQTGLSVGDMETLSIPEYSITVINMPKEECRQLKIHSDIADENNEIRVCAGSTFYLRLDGYDVTSPPTWTSSNDAELIITADETGKTAYVEATDPAPEETYYITCENNCSMDVVTVIVIPKVIVEFTEPDSPYDPLPEINTPYSPCPNSSGEYTISAEFSGGSGGTYNAIWFDSDGHGLDEITGSGNHPAITLSADSPDKIYYIVASDGLCYSGFDSVRITPYNYLTLRSDYYKCSGTNVTLEAVMLNTEGTGSYSYSWTGGSYTGSSTSSTLIATATTTTTYTVTVVGTGGCEGTYIATTTVHVEPYCTCDATGAGCTTNCVDIPPGALTDDFSPVGGVVNTKNIYIQGHTFIDKDIRFTNCNLFFDRGASMTVLNPSDPADATGITELEFKGCTLDACTNYKWDGIIMQDVNTAIKMHDPLSNGSALKNANTGISSYNDSKVELRATTFEENTRHLYFANFVNEAESDIFDCRFTSPGGSTDTCISIDNVEDIIIGDKGQGLNAFEDYTGGVYAHNSGCQLFNNEFNGNSADGIHVHALNDQFDLAGNPWPETEIIIGDGSPGDAAGNTFNNQLKHVYLDNMTANVKGNTFNDATDAFASVYSKYKSIGVNDNKFADVDRGVSIYFVLNSKIRIQNNHTMQINLPSPGNVTYGMYVGAFSNTTNNAPFLNIKGNYIDPPGITGIWLDNLDFPFATTHDTWEGVRKDTVMMRQLNTNTGYTWYGILMTNCSHPRVTANKLSGFTTGATNLNNKIGIYSAITPYGIVSCNETDSTAQAINFSGACDYAIINGNDMDNHNMGIVLGTGGEIADQPASLLPDTAPDNIYGTFNVADLYSFSIDGGLYTFYFQSSGTFIPGASTAALGGPTAIGLSAYGFSFAYDCGVILLKQSNSVNNSQSISSLNKQGFAVDSSIYMKIHRHINNDGSVADASIYAGMTYAYEELKNDSVLKNSDSSFVAWFDSSSLGNLGKFSQIKELIFNATDTTQIHNDADTITFYLDQASAINQTIIPSIRVEANKKAINNLFINKLIRHNFNVSGNEKIMVDTIATKCPYIDGPAVFEARAIQRLWNDSVFYGNDDLCDHNLPKLQKSEIVDIKDDVILYPNPASNLIMVKSNVHGILYVTDITGRKLLKRTIEQPLTKIGVDEMEPGLYNLTVYSDNKIIKTCQFIKMH